MNSSKELIFTTPGDLVKISIIDQLIKRKGIVLDLGCGVGLSIGSLLKFGIVIGLDISRDKVRTAKKHYEYVDFIMADTQYLPLKNNTFDIIVAKDVLEHIVDDQRAIYEAYRTLTNHGELILYVPVLLEEANFSIEGLIHRLTGYNIDNQAGHIRRYAVAKLISILRMSGFRETYMGYFGHIVTSMLSLLLFYSYRIIQGNEKKRSSSKLVKVTLRIFKLFEPLCILEYRALKKLPGSGLFIRVEKYGD